MLELRSALNCPTAPAHLVPVQKKAAEEEAKKEEAKLFQVSIKQPKVPEGA